VSDREKEWLMQTLANGGKLALDTGASGGGGSKKKKRSRKELFFELEESKSELEKLRRLHSGVCDERQQLTKQVASLSEQVMDLEHKQIESNRTNTELSIRLESMRAHTKARDQDVEAMETRLLEKVNALSKSETELSKKLKQSLASQSRMEQQMLEMRGSRSNFEQERQDLNKLLSSTKAELDKLRNEAKLLRSDNRQLKDENATMKAKVQRATDALLDAREYIRSLEVSDTQTRTAIAVVQKQNRTLAAFNTSLKSELGEAKAQLAMQLALEQQYDELDNGEEFPDLGVDESDLISCGVVPPPPPSQSDLSTFATYNLLSAIPNPVAERKV
jgi:chromosome segregation ATPase